MDGFIDYLSANAGLIGLLFFFVFFTIMVAWVFRPGAKSEYKKKGLIPLEEKE